MASIERLTGAERVWLTDTLATLPREVASGGVTAVSGFAVQARHGWLSLPQEDRWDPETFVNAVGVAVGEALSQERGLDWAVSREDNGRTMMALLTPGQEVVIYPIRAVAKWWSSESDATLQEHVEDRLAS